MCISLKVPKLAIPDLAILDGLNCLYEVTFVKKLPRKVYFSRYKKPEELNMQMRYQVWPSPKCNWNFLIFWPSNNKRLATPVIYYTPIFMLRWPIFFHCTIALYVNLYVYCIVNSLQLYIKIYLNYALYSV